jgi:hypothetical protein
MTEYPLAEGAGNVASALTNFATSGRALEANLGLVLRKLNGRRLD